MRDAKPFFPSVKLVPLSEVEDEGIDDAEDTVIFGQPRSALQHMSNEEFVRTQQNPFPPKETLWTGQGRIDIDNRHGTVHLNSVLVWPQEPVAIPLGWMIVLSTFVGLAAVGVGVGIGWMVL